MSMVSKPHINPFRNHTTIMPPQILCFQTSPQPVVINVRLTLIMRFSALSTEVQKYIVYINFSI